jgi:hypothetical protein
MAKKANKQVMLPELRDYIIQPNRVTNAVYDYTLYQERIFTAVMYYLQEPINLLIKKQQISQLQLFNDPNKVILKIPFKEITKDSTQYKNVRTALKAMSSVVLEMPYTTEAGQERIKFKQLLTGDVPKKADYNSYMIIEIDNAVAQKLIEIDTNRQNSPINFTRFVYQIAQRAENKYSSRLYKILCSWRQRGVFTIKLSRLKEELGATNKYAKYTDFKKRCIIPAHDELFEKADCWFNCYADNFEVRDGREVTHLHFHVITPEHRDSEKLKTDNIRDVLRNNYRFKEEDYALLEDILNNEKIIRHDIYKKIIYVADLMDRNPKKNPKKYMLIALLNEFDPGKVDNLSLEDD